MIGMVVLVLMLSWYRCDVSLMRKWCRISCGVKCWCFVCFCGGLFFSDVVIVLV